ncbi:hypothetical protein Pmani_029777 [Petrolisthes manimaculis]|uniref:Uncharacterized protein n=1 Tax=Petrolisthes manimaculis TaxID=1843537 RepID=A0AAE1NYR9_9EUCA|nr:hypothetical protein Pmani_029777 [Petrolisthes manimaculis]
MGEPGQGSVHLEVCDGQDALIPSAATAASAHATNPVPHHTSVAHTSPSNPTPLSHSHSSHHTPSSHPPPVSPSTHIPTPLPAPSSLQFHSGYASLPAPTMSHPVAAMSKTCYETYPAQPSPYSYYDNFNNGYGYDSGGCGQYYDEYVDYRTSCGLASNMMPQHMMMQQGQQTEYGPYMTAAQKMGYYDHGSYGRGTAWTRDHHNNTPKKSPLPAPDQTTSAPAHLPATQLQQHSQQQHEQQQQQQQPQQQQRQQQQSTPGQTQAPSVVTPPSQLTPVSLPPAPAPVRESARSVWRVISQRGSGAILTDSGTRLPTTPSLP